MFDPGVITAMPPEKAPKRGRPKSVPSPLRSIVSLKGSEELEGWLDRLTEASSSATRSHTIRRALKVFADSVGFTEEVPKR